MKEISNIFQMIKGKCASLVSRKRRSLDKIQRLGLETYLKSKIEKYADSPALVAHFKKELHSLR